MSAVAIMFSLKEIALHLSWPFSHPCEALHFVHTNARARTEALTDSSSVCIGVTEKIVNAFLKAFSNQASYVFVYYV